MKTSTQFMDYKLVIQFKHNGKWWVTAQATTIEAANIFIEQSKKEFAYEYRAIPFEQYEKELTTGKQSGLIGA